MFLEVIVAFFIFAIGGGIAYRAFLLPESSAPVTTGVVREITVRAAKDEWRFEPEVIMANRGDKIILTAVNEDDYDHGIAIDAFGITQRMPANGTVELEFVVTELVKKNEKKFMEFFVFSMDLKF